MAPNFSSTQSLDKRWVLIFDESRYQASKLELKASLRQIVHEPAKVQKVEPNPVAGENWPSLMERQRQEEPSLRKKKKKKAMPFKTRASFRRMENADFTPLVV